MAYVPFWVDEADEVVPEALVPFVEELELLELLPFAVPLTARDSAARFMMVIWAEIYIVFKSSSASVSRP